MARMRTYTPEFRESAVAMVASHGLPIRRAAAEARVARA